MESLVEKAKKFRPKRDPRFSQDEVQLAVAWAKGIVTTGQVISITKKSSGSLYLFLARALAQYTNSK